MTGARPRFTERRYVVPLVLVTSLFFLWALGVNLNDILIPHLKKAFGLTDFQSSLIQTAFFGGYFVAALPAGAVMRRLGYARGIQVGLLVCATGALLFIPASIVRAYPVFLMALFVMACGQCFLEVGANPYVTTLGPSETAPWRLNTAQAFNSVGAAVTPVIGATFILSGIEYTGDQIAAMAPADLDAYRAMEAGLVRGPYVVIAAIFLFVAFLFWRVRLPEYPDIDMFFEDLAQVYREELKALGELGCTYVQLDDTNLAYLCDPAMRERTRAIGEDPDRLPRLYADVINRAIAGRPANMTMCVHLCRGNFQSAWVAEGGYEPVAEALFQDLKVDGYFLEYDDERSGDFKPLRFVPKGKTVVLGLISSKVPALEPKDAIKRRIDEAAQFCPLDQLALSPQCGFSSTVEGNLITEDDEIAKLGLVMDVAHEVWG